MHAHRYVGGRAASGTSGREKSWMDLSRASFIQYRTRCLKEFVEHGHNGDADDQERDKFDGQFLFHLLDVAFQFGFGDLKFDSDCLKIGLDFINVVL